MQILLVVVGLMVATVVLVGVGERLRLPWPALMVVLGAGVAITPGLPDGFRVDPDLILPLFLPPLLFATAQRTSWALFRARWRTIALLAVGLVLVTATAVAGTAWLLVPGIAVTAAIALGAMVAPPDPVAVEAVAGQVRIPRRLVSVLQSEGLFNDATALVIFQAAVLATVAGDELSPLGLGVRFVAGAAGAVVVGLAVAWLARRVLGRLTDTVGRSALTLVLPFATYLAAEEIHASGVIAVVVLALQLRAGADADEAAERLTQTSLWNVVELLVTGLAFGLIGLDLRQVVTDAGDDLPRMLGHAAIVCLVVIAVRVLWMVAAWRILRRTPGVADAGAAPVTGREAVLLSWCGMRGLATLALALSLPFTTATGEPFPARAELVLIAVSVLLVTLLVPGFTLPALVRALDVDDEAEAEERAEREIVGRARRAAMATIQFEQQVRELPAEVGTALRERADRLAAMLAGETPSEDERQRIAMVKTMRDQMAQAQAAALAAARAEVLAARREPGVDPHAADRVLRRLDLRTVLLD
ncbi:MULTISPECIES: Na+/H+ antiporter [Pseudonocardia]|uniref:Sodium, potassium, lithium and rubidium/H(+) antiporter n=2 Tax=Pseudonocardia TaxID=1847 RepID=A0A1Y2N6S2_PSEAH|nr:MULTISPECIES: Na+/H+ antiporter [Pseudonocardia]OSY43160.1 Sodium, potassium, lithium and rubidium/H(+) antiporter [Pseudonocardia autotrophica]TDN71648.1 sodium/proton antiporter (CPA1 family) [Pseudonocardia autotrophica]BBG02335.1 Na+/H+ antiporter [Pseudonocardia autotrophica]GEC23329.1 Na+/H+ antiporter [Pseudonocardia saturnea]